MEKKMTQREFLSKAIEIMNTVEGLDEEYVKKGNEMIASLDKKKNSKTKADEKKVAEQKALTEDVRRVLSSKTDRTTTSAIAKELELTTQKITPILVKMIAEGTVKAEVEKRVKYYSLVE